VCVCGKFSCVIIKDIHDACVCTCIDRQPCQWKNVVLGAVPVFFSCCGFPVGIRGASLSVGATWLARQSFAPRWIAFTVASLTIAFLGFPVGIPLASLSVGATWLARQSLAPRWIAFAVASLIIAFLDTLPMSMTPLFRSIVYMLGNVCIHSCLAALAFKCHSAVLLDSLRYLTSCHLAHNHSRSSLVIVAVMPKIPMKYRAPSAWPMPKRGKVRANLKKPAAATKRANKKASNVPYTRVKGFRTKFYKERVR